MLDGKGGVSIWEEEKNVRDNWTGGQNVIKENKFIQIKLFYSSTTTIYSARQRYLKQSIWNEQGETFIEY